MKTDNITEIGIDDLGRLYIKPEKERFEFIYRDATGVDWNIEQGYLHSPVPREWTYFMWFKQILISVANEYGYNLVVIPSTQWISIPSELKKEISNWVTQ